MRPAWLCLHDTALFGCSRRIELACVVLHHHPLFQDKMSQGCPRKAVSPIGQDDTHHAKSTGEAFQITLQTQKGYYLGNMGHFMRTFEFAQNLLWDV